MYLLMQSLLLSMRSPALHVQTPLLSAHVAGGVVKHEYPVHTSRVGKQTRFLLIKP